jgi:hypothetical protein
MQRAAMNKISDHFFGLLLPLPPGVLVPIRAPPPTGAFEHALPRLDDDAALFDSNSILLSVPSQV